MYCINMKLQNYYIYQILNFYPFPKDIKYNFRLPFPIPPSIYISL